MEAPADVELIDQIFATEDGIELPYLHEFEVDPAITPVGELAAQTLSDTLFGAMPGSATAFTTLSGAFSYFDAETADTILPVDQVFAKTAGAIGTTLFDFVPPPAPKLLPPTPYGSGSELPPPPAVIQVEGTEVEEDDNPVPVPDSGVEVEDEMLMLVGTAFHHFRVEGGALRFTLKRVNLLNCDAALPSIQLFI